MVTLIVGDLFIAISAFYISIILRFGELQEGLLQYNPVVIRLALFVVVLLLSSFFSELYEREKNSGKKEILLRSFIAGSVSFVILSSLYYILPFIKVWRGTLILSLTVFITFQVLWHITYLLFLNFPGFAKRVLILGTGPIAESLGRLLVNTNHNYVLSGYISYPPEPISVPAIYLMNSGESITETVTKERVHKIVISMSERRGVLPINEIMTCKLNGIDVIDAPSLYEEVTGKLFIESIKPSWFIFSDGFKITSFKKNIKRMFDIVLSTTGLLIASPLVLLIAFFIKIDSPGSIIYRQVRIGEKEKHFTLYKFRTMCQNAESKTGAVWTQKKDRRITRIGKFLRKSRLDEIPQLINVLKGDMSFIGPRPERPEFVKKLKEIIPYYSERHFVKPGITGWAQVKYAYGASVEDSIEKLRYDLYYIKNQSLFLDMLIILETIKVVFFGRGSR